MSIQLALMLPMPAPVLAPERILLVDPADQLVAERRMAALQMLFDFEQDPFRFGRLRLKDGSPITGKSRMVQYVAESHGCSRVTIWDWLKRWKTGGPAALADKQPDRSRSRFFERYPKAKYLAAYLYLECRQSVRAAYEAIVRDPAMVEIPPDELPSYETVRVFLDAVPAALAVYAREGRKAYRDRMSPYLQRQFTDVYANEVWVGDVMIFDILAWNDVFSNLEWGAKIRARLDDNIDYRSRRLVGYSFCWEGSSRSVAATQLMSIRRFGPCSVFYTDNGKAQDKAAKGATPGYLARDAAAPHGWRGDELAQIESSGFLARVGTAIQQCLPFHPQAKSVERFHRTIHERFCRAWPTYTSGSPFTRPDATTAEMMRHDKLMRHGDLVHSGLPPLSRVLAAFTGWAEEYDNTPHGGEGMEGCTPRQVFEANLNPNQRPTPDGATLALLMAEHERRLVRECAVTLNKRRYQPVDQAGWSALHCLNQTEIIVAYEPGAPQHAAALGLDGTFICSLEAEELVGFAPGDAHTGDLVQASMSQRRRLEKQMRETLQDITLVARQNGALSPLESMAARLQLPSGADTDLSRVVTQRPSKPTTLTASDRPSTPAEAARLFMEKTRHA